MNPYIGTTLGNYRILEQIGQGGMATVFKAYQPSMDRYVAVKVLPSHFTQDRGFLGRFNQEARTLARLEHPHILPVYDYGEQDGTTYLVMRYINAGTLSDLIAQCGPMELEEIVPLMNHIGQALAYAHSQGVIHRDIKPSNVLIDEQSNAFLTDFGIAKLIAGTAQFTGTGTILGTPAYMAPEQGLDRPLDHRCDIYALGVMLYEMVTGQVPYDAETPLAVLLKHVHEPLRPPRLVRHDLPEAVERVILKAMAKSPADRFQTAQEMADKLEKAVAGLPTDIVLPPAPGGPTAVLTEIIPESTAPTQSLRATEVRPPSPKTQKTRKRFPWLLAGGGIGILAVIAIVAWLILPGFGSEDMPGEPFFGERPPLAEASGYVPGVEIIVDNEDPGFHIESGRWDDCFDGDCGGISYGEFFLYADPGCFECRAVFELFVPQSGEYTLWAWWPQGDDRAMDTPFTILHEGDPIRIRVDQRHNGSHWVPLEVIPLHEGEIVQVIIEGTESGYANADAVGLASVNE
jgi:serine/threonine protein kinase